MRNCGICNASLAEGANLCTPCADLLSKPPGFCAEQLLSTALKPTDAALVDCWGRVHFLEDMTPIGRRPVARGTAILEASVSRNHAEMSRDESGIWVLRDTGSSNGTKVDDRIVTEPTPLAKACKVTFGGVGLYFLPDASGLIANRVVASTATVRPEDLQLTAPEDEPAMPEEPTFAGFPKIKTQMFRSSAGGAGLLDMNGIRVQLTSSQFELVELLVAQMRVDAGLPIEVRGFVPSTNLVASVTWDSPYPTDNHLKQLIRRVRKMLESAELGNLIESRRGFGYRLRCLPIEVAGSN
jgi:hypothetical protein